MGRALAVVGAMSACASVASATVTTERATSLVAFPKVIAQGTRDTIIQISNVSNMPVFAHCYYINGALTNPDEDPGPFNPPLWNELNFDIALTKQQPTMWLVSEGREVDPTDCPGTPDCYGAGIDIGSVPPTPDGFTGELRCFETMADGTPVRGDHLKGEATLVDNDGISSGDISKYNGIGFPLVTAEVDEDNYLCMGGDDGATSDQCPNGPEYDGCPNIWVLNHFADGAADPIVVDQGVSGSNIRTELTVVPCTEDLENQAPSSVTVQFLVTNEYETTLSASTTYTCWGNSDLEDINPNAFTRDALDTDFAQTRIRAVGQGGVLLVAEEFHSISDGPASVAAAAFNPVVEGERSGLDVTTIQPDLVSTNPRP
jgi:hypothetical protein